MRAAGRTPSQVQAEIVTRIKDRAIEPQAVVALVTQNTSLITVIGEVNDAFRLPAEFQPSPPASSCSTSLPAPAASKIKGRTPG